MDFEGSLCTLCLKAASLMCRRCFQIYCSTKCQALDWNTHKTVCIEMPSLAPLDPLIAASRSSVQSRLNVSNLLHLDDTDGRKENDSASIQSKRTNSVADNSFRSRTIHQQVDTKPLRRVDNFKPKQMSADERSKQVNYLKTTRIALTDDNFKMKMSDDGEREREREQRSVDVGKKTIANELQRERSNGDLPLASAASVEMNNMWQSHNVPPMREWFEAIIQYVEEMNPTVIWIMERRFDADLTKLLSEISRNVPRDKPCTAPNIFVGKLVAVCMLAASSNIIYRAEVIEIFPDVEMCLVCFIDYGTVEKVSFSELYEASSAMMTCKAYTIRVRTTQVFTLEEIGSVINIRIMGAKTSGGFYMAEIQNNASKLKVRPNETEKVSNLALEPSGVTLEKVGLSSEPENTPLPPSRPVTPALTKETDCNLTRNNVKPVEEQFQLEQKQVQQDEAQQLPQKILQQKQPRSINLVMSNLSLGTKGSAENGISNEEAKSNFSKVYMLDDLEVVPFSTGDNVPIMVMDTSQQTAEGYITAIDLSNEKVGSIQKNLVKVSEYCKNASKDSQTGYSPKSSELCLAVFDSDQQWYRAVCCQAFDGDFYQILFIDYGNKSMVKRNNIMPISKDLMFPNFTNRCYVDESLRAESFQPGIKYKVSIQKRNNCLNIVRCE